MAPTPTSPVVAAAVLGGYAIGRSTGNRRLAGVALLAGLGWSAPRWAATSLPLAVALTAGTVALVGASHPLSKRVGPWPAVLASTAAAGALAAVGDGVASRR
ncbi:hypothetical protein MO973_06325 [Paenibacillus sp. TRM 82003]|uniref:hypothetical protein n=1 Tax=Kineococcus sp. TRM81007 TaxID=2925831 RepID=UPI001F5AC250|nr:hypothetical protein [Kineococcus sp. TRM81007]MCI2237494.1 hypothetical protein [Kineococcus sp. TRM81007]MCI3919847.1 hypothetical protein [Paenibacillus sp. TRM 82003]